MLKRTLIAIIFLVSVFSYAQTGATGANGAPVGAYKPNTNSGSDLDPADRPPADVLKEDGKLVAKLQKLLPPNLTPQTACDGFKKLVDCVSAIHAAQNVGVVMTDLKSKVLADKSHDALEKAIHALKPDIDAKSERKKAQKQAEKDIPVD